MYEIDFPFYLCRIGRSRTNFLNATATEIPQFKISSNDTENYYEIHQVYNSIIWILYTLFIIITLAAVQIIIFRPNIIFKKWLPRLLPSRPLEPAPGAVRAPEATPAPAPATSGNASTRSK
jgi:hypothetical protein